MYQPTTLDQYLYFDIETYPINTLLLNSVTPLDRAITSFGTITRQMEYDTGKFQPGSHSFTMSNSRDFGDYLYTLRNSVNGTNVPGHDYWTDLKYQVSVGYQPANSLNNPAITLYEGIITDKTEDRMNETCSVTSNDILRNLSVQKVLERPRVANTVFDALDGNDDTSTFQEHIKYGVNNLIYSTTDSAFLCSVVFGSAVPYDYCIVTCTGHGRVVGDLITISGTTHYNGEQMVSQVIDADHFYISLNQGGTPGAETGIYTYYAPSANKSNLDNPWSALPCIKNNYISCRHGLPQTVAYDNAVLSISHVYTKPGSPNTVYFQLSTEHNVIGSHNYFVKNSTHYNDHYVGTVMGGTISAAASSTGGGWTRLTINTPFPPALASPFKITVTNTTNYNGNWGAVYIDSTHIDIPVAYVSSQTGYYYSRNMIDGTHSLDGDDTGTMYWGNNAEDIGYLWYCPTINPVKQADVTAIWYWDYRISQWCKFDDNNLTNPNYGFVVVDNSLYAPSVPGIYIQNRTVGRIADHGNELKWSYGDDWNTYLAGNGWYWNSLEPMPKIALEFKGYVYFPYGIGGSTENCYANPVAVYWDLLKRCCGFNAEIDASSFHTPDVSYSFDAAISYFQATPGNYATGAQINVSYDSAVSLLDLVQNIGYVVGCNLICSNILTTTDRRLKLVLTKTYVPATDYPVAKLQYSTNNDLTKFTIKADNVRIKNQIITTNFIPGTSLNNTLERIINGTGTLILEIATEDYPPIYWYNSHNFSNTVGAAYLSKLGTAWEIINIEQNKKALLVECGDYVELYDHKTAETIVGQVYTWSYNLDTETCSIELKKCWSSKD